MVITSAKAGGAFSYVKVWGVLLVLVLDRIVSITWADMMIMNSPIAQRLIVAIFSLSGFLIDARPVG